jgi:methylmalonyl-CoA carboxyltransferase small subunit
MKLNISVDGQKFEVEVEVAEPEPPAGAIYARTPSSSNSQGSRPAAAPAQPSGPEPAADEAKVVRSPLAGVVSRVETEAGAEVKPEQEILVLEAMKMFTSITSPKAGKIKAILVGVADPVKQGQILVEFE